MAKANYSTEVQTAGLFGNNNEVTVPPGAIAIGDNVIINRDNVYERRPGFDSCSNGLPASTPKQLWSDHDSVYVHINEELYYQSGDCNWQLITGIVPTFVSISAITDDPDYIYVFDYSVLRRIRKTDGLTETMAGKFGVFGSVDGDGSVARFGIVYGMCVYNGKIYVADTDGQAIRTVSLGPPFTVTTVAGSLGVYGAVDGIGAAARFDTPTGIVGPFSGYFYITDLANDAIRKMDVTTADVTTFAGALTMGGYVDDPVGINARFAVPRALGSDGSYLYLFSNFGVMRKVDISTSAVTTIGVDPNYSIFQLSANGGMIYYGDSLFSDFSLKAMKISDGSISIAAGSATSRGYVNGYGTSARFSRIAPTFISSGSIYICELEDLRLMRLSDGYVSLYAGTPGTSEYLDGIRNINISAPSE